MEKQDVNVQTRTIGSPVKSSPSDRTLAESVVHLMGSWQFVLSQSVVLFVCTGLSIYFSFRTWNPLPFIVLNLVLSLQATLTTPVILIVQNKQSDHGKKIVYASYYVSSATLKRVRELSSKVDKLTPP